ncbi:MAG: transporter substrate-binding domain-containing protein [Acidimicrobiia bacterium]
MKARLWTILLLTAMIVGACGGSDGATTTTTTTPTDTSDTTVAAGGDDLLAKILADGEIAVSTDPAYPPQSELNPTTNEYEGFDIDVANEIASRLGVTVTWETPAWESIVSGSWQDRWQMSVGSMTVTTERAAVLDFAPAYYYTPAAVAVHADNTTITDTATDLDGATIGVCGGCSYDFFLQKTLEIPGYTFDFVIDDAEIVTYDTDSTAVADLAIGDGDRLDAAISSLTVFEGAIADGVPIKVVGDPIYYEPLAAAFDKSSTLDGASLVDRVGQIVDEMHADGTMSELSMKWFGVDYTVTG